MYAIIKRYYDMYIYDDEKLRKCVKSRMITEQEFYNITGYSYQ